jgi:hypothetical protein
MKTARVAGGLFTTWDLGIDYGLKAAATVDLLKLLIYHWQL